MQNEEKEERGRKYEEQISIQANPFRGDGGSHHLIHGHFTADGVCFRRTKSGRTASI